jgi:myo-inositol-1(or 4)-monophosphatase
MYESELDLAIKAATASGEYLRKRDSIKIETNSGKDIKLSSDKASEQIIFDYLKDSHFSILSEECGLITQESEYCWVVDPIDGTQNYYNDMPELACISIALYKEQDPIFGIIYRFNTDELFVGIVGQGAYLNNKPIIPSGIQIIGQAVLATGFPLKRNYTTESLSVFIKQIQRFKKVRMLGSAALMAVFVANGRIDAYIEDEIMFWDIAAAAAIVKASGGSIKIVHLKNYKCICHCFANRNLMDNYNDKIL